jgi:arginine/lysine/ornithine decarboxylase
VEKPLFRNEDWMYTKNQNSPGAIPMRFLRLDSDKRAKKTRISREKHLQVEYIPLEKTCCRISAELISTPEIIPGFNCLVKGRDNTEDVVER